MLSRFSLSREGDDSIISHHYEKEIDELFGEDADWRSKEIREFIDNFNKKFTPVLIHFTHVFGLDANTYFPDGMFSVESEVLVVNDSDIYYMVLNIETKLGYTLIKVKPIL